VTDPFERHRRLLFTVAYEMLGSAADAEDTVQDAWLRWSAADRGDVADPKAYLIRVTTRLALNRLRAARTRRESYVGPWLPEPLLTAPDVAEEVEMAESVSMALLVVLETLSPVERAVFVLREVFGLSHHEVADVVDRSEPAVRQLAHRAREHVRDRRPRFDTDRQTQREVTQRFLAACLNGDVAALVSSMSPGVTLVSDGGGKAKAALRPIVGADKVARFLVAVTQESAPGLQLEFADVNGAPGLIARAGTEAFLAAQVQLVAGRIEQVLIFRNPEKLTRLGTEQALSQR
jgi:RNA polymerase sigma-70 factor (ECF subfamily)